MSSPSSSTKANRRSCFVYKEDYPWDVRVEKILLTLRSAGHEVSLLCRNTKRLPSRESTPDFEIHRLPVIPMIGRRLNDLLSLPFYFNVFWFYWVWRTMRLTDADDVVIRDLPLMPLAIVAGKLTGARVVFDMAECYPEMYASTLQFSDAKLGKFILKNPWFAGRMERFAFRHADLILVMIEESRERLVRLGASPDKVIIVSNTPPRSAASHPREHQTSDELRLLYVGFVTRIRGIDTILRGLQRYRELHPEGPKVRLDVVGIGAALDANRRLCNELGLQDRVTFHGWASHETVDHLYRHCDIGLLTYHVCSHWNHTIPNKLFDYMAAGLPVLTTDVVTISRIVRDIGCGVVFGDNDYDACAAGILMLSDEDQRRDMGRRGQKAVESKFNWEADSAKLVEALGSLSP